MVLISKKLNQRFDINTYHQHLIKNKVINIYNVVENNITKIQNESSVILISSNTTSNTTSNTLLNNRPNN